MPDASAGGTGGHRVIEIRGPIYMGDVITTDIKGQVDILFVDDHVIRRGGEFERVTIERLRVRRRQEPRRMSASVRSGCRFSFITGKSPKDNYSIKTPTTIDRRPRCGTFDLAVRAGSGRSTLVVHEGGTQCLRRDRRQVSRGSAPATWWSGEAGGGSYCSSRQGNEISVCSRSFP